ncbi:aspartic peptidase domain-containing protein [Lipomyces kononenkoae]
MQAHYVHSQLPSLSGHLLLGLLLSCLLFDSAHALNDKAVNQDLQTTKTVLLPIEAPYHAQRTRLVKDFDFLYQSEQSEFTFATPYNDRWKFSYMVNITIGNPPQPVSLQLDSRALEIWVQSSANPGCRNTDLEFCAISGVYNRRKSTTARATTYQGTITYEDSTYARALAIEDVATVGGKEIPSLIFGESNESTALYGRVGLGRMSKTGGTRPDTLQNKMIESGLTNVAAYSLWLDDHDSSTGAILFGGVDNSKFEGELINIDLAPLTEKIPNMYYINIVSIAANIGGKRSKVIGDEYKFPIALNPMTSWSFLPFYIGSRLATKIGGTKYNRNLGTFMIDCERSQLADFVEFEFAGVKVPVLLKQLVSKVGETDKGQPICALAFTAILPKKGDVIQPLEYFLGDSVLRSAYVVYGISHMRCCNPV